MPAADSLQTEVVGAVIFQQRHDNAVGAVDVLVRIPGVVDAVTLVVDGALGQPPCYA